MSPTKPKTPQVMPHKLDCNDSSGSNPVQELGQKQLTDLQRDLKQVKQLRKQIQKKRKDVQKQAMEQERKQAVSNVKYENIIDQKEQATKEMQDLRMQISFMQKKIEELEKRQETVLKKKEKATALYSSQRDADRSNEDELKAYITKARQDLKDMHRFNSTKSQQYSKMVEELESERQKRLNAKVNSETLKNRKNFVEDNQDKELDEQLRLDQQLQRLKTLAAERDQQRSHIKELIERQQGNLQNIISENVQLIDTGKELTETQNNLRGLINKLIRELKCAKHDEENLADMVREGDIRVANLKSQLDQELEKYNGLLKSIQKKEAIQGEGILFSSCQSSVSKACIALSSPTLSPTKLVSIDGSKKASSSSCNERLLNSARSSSDSALVVDSGKGKWKSVAAQLQQHSCMETRGEEESLSVSETFEEDSINATFESSLPSEETTTSYC